MSKISEALDKISTMTSAPISYPDIKNKVANEDVSTNVEEEIDLDSINWNLFTIDGIGVVDLLIRAINSLISKYYQDSQKTDGITFNLSEIYELAGIDNVDETYKLINDKEEELAKLADEEGYGWRYYCTKTALEKFETEADWDVEICDNGYDRKYVEDRIDDIVRMLESPIEFFGLGFSFVNFLGINPFKSQLTDENKKNIINLTLEKLLGSYTVTMTVAEEEEVEDEDEDEDNFETGVMDQMKKEEKEDKKIKTSSRVASPQKTINLESILKEIGLNL